MKDRLFVHLSDKHSSNINELIKNMGTRHPPKQFNEHLNELIQQVNNYVKDQNGKVEDIVSPKNSSQDLTPVRIKKQIMDNYQQLYAFNQQITKEESYIQRIEDEAYRRALKYRTLTTLSIGFGILIVYAAAQYIGINLPLMRVGA